MTTESSQSDPFPYPLRRVVGVFEDQGQVDRFSAALQQSGVAEDRIAVLHGEADAERLDLEGDDHGLRGRLIRALQAISDSELQHLHRYAAHLRAGDHVVGVEVSDDEDQQDDDVKRAVEALRAAGATFVNYYDESYVQSFDAP